MPFTEKLKKEVRMKSDVRCVICHEPFVDIHHIIPQELGGPDTFDNAVALCPSCHFKYGNNPDLRKQIKEKRDSWYEMVEAKKKKRIQIVKEKIFLEKEEENNDEMTAIYHVVYENEDFNTAATDLVKLTSDVIKKFKDKKRILYLDIDGHRNKQGGFDHDMFELQKDFILGNLIYYYSEVHMPLGGVKNRNKQSNDFDCDEFKIIDKLPEELKDYEGKILFTDENINQ